MTPAVAGIQLPSPRQLEAVSSLKSVNARQETTTLKHSSGGVSRVAVTRKRPTEELGANYGDRDRREKPSSRYPKAQKRYGSTRNSDLGLESGGLVAVGSRAGMQMTGSFQKTQYMGPNEKSYE